MGRWKVVESWADVPAEGSYYEGFEPFGVIRDSPTGRAKVFWKKWVEGEPAQPVREQDRAPELSDRVEIVHERDPADDSVETSYTRKDPELADAWAQARALLEERARQSRQKAEYLLRKVHPTLSAGTGLTRSELEWVLYEVRYLAAKIAGQDLEDAPPPQLTAPPATALLREKEWDEFRAAGLLWWVNTFLHAFGWAITTDVEDGHVLRAYPARTRGSGWDEKSQGEGFRKLHSFLLENMPAIYLETTGHDPAKEKQGEGES